VLGLIRRPCELPGVRVAVPSSSRPGDFVPHPPWIQRASG